MHPKPLPQAHTARYHYPMLTVRPNNKLMSSSIREIYTMVNHLDGAGVEGYHVDNKYVDPLKMKEQRILETSKDRIQSKKLASQLKKTSFIDQVQKKQAKLPGPCSYDPKELVPKSKTEAITPPAPRQTIFDEIEHNTKRANFPGAGAYGKVEVQTDRTRLKSNISKAENANYLDTSMRYSLQSPGVGEYNSYHGTADHRAIKWVPQSKTKPKEKEGKVRLPPVGTYNPLPMAYSLFDNSLADKRRGRSYFSRQERFKKSREKPVPFYDVASEWGIQDKRKKKDILQKISLPYPNRSVYH